MSGTSGMRSSWSEQDAGRTAHVRLSTVTLHIGDALELSELLDYLAQWLGAADPAARADLATFAWDRGAIRNVPAQPVSFCRLLVFGHAPVEPDLHGGGEGRQW